MAAQLSEERWHLYWRTIESHVPVGGDFSTDTILTAIRTATPSVSTGSTLTYRSSLIKQALNSGLMTRVSKCAYRRTGTLDDLIESQRKAVEGRSPLMEAAAKARRAHRRTRSEEAPSPSLGRWQRQAPGSSNCVQVCLAGILHRPVCEVPDFVAIKQGYWYQAFRAWLDDQGFEVLRLTPQHAPTGYYLAVGTTERGTMHMVVCRDGVLHHDPHVSDAGLTDIRDILVLVPHDPSRAARVSSPIPGKEV